MPGLKRKADRSPVVTNGKSNGPHSAGKKSTTKITVSKTASKLQHEKEDSFDDDEDLMAGALERSSEEAEMSDSKTNDDTKGNGHSNGVEMLSDEDMEGGFEDVSENVEAQAGPSRPTNKDSLYAIPSRDEMSALRNTSELYKSNIFKLKVEEMVSQIRPKYDSTETLDYVVRRIKAIVEALDDIEPATLDKALKSLRKSSKGRSISVPFPEPAPSLDSNVKFGFATPARVQVVGSWILKTAALRPEGADIDMVLTMPSSLFQEKDHLNMRYFHKRAYYLAVIASALSQYEKELGLQCEYSVSQDDPYRSLLVLKAVKGSATNFTKSKAIIKVHLAHGDDVFPARRLSPGRNNVRIEGLSEEKQPATPSYNAALLADGLFFQHLIYLNSTSQMCSSFSEACILLKTWLLQRSFGSGLSKDEVKGKTGHEAGRRIASGANGMRFIVMMLLAHLLHGSEKSGVVAARSKLSPGFSSYQLFRGTIDFLATHDFATNPIYMKAIDGLLSRRDKIDGDEFARQSKYVIVDPTGSINLLQNVNIGTFDLLQAEARSTMGLLNDPEEDHFGELFLTRRWRPNFYFDEVLSLNAKAIQSDASLLANFGSKSQVAIHQITQTIAKALNTRAKIVTVFPSSSSHWHVTDSRPKETYKIEVGIMLDPQQAFRLVDHGPRPEDQAAEEFKAFWGEIAELRRFRDGRIVESVVWTVDGVMGKYDIPKMISRHILPRHCNIRSESIVFHSDAFQGLLEPDVKLATNAYLASPKQGGFQTIQTAFDDLVKQMRGLDDLPLSIISIVGADPGLRSMSVMVPCPINRNASIPLCSSYLAVHDFVITLESSGRWPDDLVAIRAMKMAFYESMARKLREILPSCQAQVVLDVDADANKYWDCSALEIVLSSGFAFQGRIHHERERTLLHRILDDKAEDQHEKAMAKSALERFESRFEHNVRHHNHMAALSHRFVSLSSTVRLFKRWISCQMFGIDVPEPLSELIVASVYIRSSEGGMIPSSGHTGFIQTLQYLAEWNWREDPLAIALAGATSATPTSTLPSETKSAIATNIEQIRRLDPGMNHYAWFIATESEPKGCNWAKSHPSSGTADALQRLASAACGILSAGPYLSRNDIKSLFMPSLRHYDFLIHLKPNVINRYIDNIAFDEELLEKAPHGGIVPMSGGSFHAGLDTGKDFALLLESLYLDSFRLYYDSIGGCIIGGLFNPSLSKGRPFRVGLGFNSMPNDDLSKEVVLNKEDIMAEIARLGKGIVQKIERRMN